jgi:hypothetical protein
MVEVVSPGQLPSELFNQVPKRLYIGSTVVRGRQRDEPHSFGAGGGRLILQLELAALWASAAAT